MPRYMFFSKSVEKIPKKFSEKFGRNRKKRYLCIAFERKPDGKRMRALFRQTGSQRLHEVKSSGCSSARLEYASGGRVVASSNLVTPTKAIEKMSCRLRRDIFLLPSG